MQRSLIALAIVNANKLYFYIIYPPANLSGKDSVGPPTLEKPGSIKVLRFHCLIASSICVLLSLHSFPARQVYPDVDMPNLCLRLCVNA